MEVLGVVWIKREAERREWVGLRGQCLLVQHPLVAGRGFGAEEDLSLHRGLAPFDLWEACVLKAGLENGLLMHSREN